ncbi:baseplate multidomain protein megatron [Paragemmobacter ruber]|uniref:Host specificity protein n=1 Tax=Paragemmobacter ruber TaxID=1985673 RepID=A0ABW9YAA9_9RHOB|nr:glycoside hydrolase TIM-barrel-like domain-containing protein [Rhodobacter ruber]NBE08675.1 host specificity protein [Rhodobacter ruber]
MATIILAAAGAFVGAGFGGTVLGLSGAVIGRAVGATVGRAIDQRLFGAGSEPVATGRLDRLRLMSSGFGGTLPMVWGRVRVGGQVIWAAPFTEMVSQSGGGGKGAPRPTVTSYSYGVSVAVALCEGVIQGVGRVWADGTEVDPARLGMRVYPGSETQLPDPKIAAVEGAAAAPAYRGTAYVVFEDLALAEYGNRVPQFTFEVIRPAQGALADQVPPFAAAIRGVALIPGTGEYSLAMRKVTLPGGLGGGTVVNQHSPAGESDLAVSLGQMRRELPGVESVSLVVSWFGSDLRCGQCDIRPKVEQVALDGIGMPWRAGGIGRAQAAEVPRVAGRSIYGGTPADAAVIEAIRAIRAGGQRVMFYPFILMEQVAGNGLTDPYSGAEDQPVLPWRGRITLSVAPGRAGTPDRTVAAAAEVAAFFGAALPAHFTRSGETITYTGPAEDWGLRRFILHYAHLCAAAGGVEAFCIGSELREVTAIRGAGDSFPAVAALRALAADCRAILGPAVKIGYAADWTEYSGLNRDGNRYFHLDPLWADAAVDFVGIDNYMPLSDWREGEDHADADRGGIHDLRYLRDNVEGGEGYDWFYAAPEGEAAQRREPITDGAGEPWIWRVKDIRNWWGLPHHERIGGVRAALPTDWVPMGKPIWFTEYGCPAVDKGTNQPNLFFDAASSEGALPRASRGMRDDLIQMQYYRALLSHWGTAGVNPLSPVYGGPMVDLGHAHAWAWDARPYPAFPLREEVWADGPNHARGHWLNGRATAQPVEAVLAEIAGRAGLDLPDLDGVQGVVRGYALDSLSTGRAAIQPLMLSCGFDAAERGGRLAFRRRMARVARVVEEAALAVDGEEPALVIQRGAEAEAAGRLRVAYLDGEGEYRRLVADVLRPDHAGAAALDQEVPLALLPEEARAMAERWLSEARVGRDVARFALPPSGVRLAVGDVVRLAGQRWRIDRAEQAGLMRVEASRVEPGVYLPGPDGRARGSIAPFLPAVPVYPLFLDLPLMTGQEEPQAPHLAVTATPWPGRVALWGADGADGFTLNGLRTQPAVMGETENALAAARAGLWDRGPALRVRFASGAVAAAAEGAVLNGANLAAIGDGSAEGWELFQFAGAALVGPNTWDLSMRLRGQAGTEAEMPTFWPAGSQVVLIDAAVTQIDLPPSLRGLERTWRIGAAERGFDDPDVVERRLGFAGIGLRPLSVGHLRAGPGAGGLRLHWLRRTRIDGDNWTSAEVPLGEEREAYHLRVRRGAVVLREVEVTVPEWTYPPAWRQADGPDPVTVEVAQLSARFGAGPYRAVQVA